MTRLVRSSRMTKLSLTAIVAVILLGGALWLGTGAFAKGTPYTPQTHKYTMTAVPVLVHEMQGTLPYLQKDFAKGGLLDNKEVYTYLPSTLVVYQGDTVDLTLVNPADDPHSFTISQLNINVAMPGGSSTTTSFVATKAGIYTYYCNEAEHFPFMWGQLIVLPAPTGA